MMGTKINKEGSLESVKKKLETPLSNDDEDREKRLNKLFGSLKLKEDAVTMERRWRDEW